MESIGLAPQVTTVKSNGVKEQIRIKKHIEDNDPDWQLVRYKHSDDATGIYISLEI